MTTSDRTITSEPRRHRSGRQRPRRPAYRALAAASVAGTLGIVGAGVGLAAPLPAPAAGAATTRPLVRGKVAALGTGTFTLTRGVATITVDVSPTTTYADAAVSGATFATLSVGTRVAVEGSLAGTNLVDASAVRIVTGTPSRRLPALRLGEARLGAGLGRVRGALAYLPLSCPVGTCRGTLRLSVTEVVLVHRGRSVVRRDELMSAGVASYAMAAGPDHVVAVRLEPGVRSALERAPGRRLAATATILGAGQGNVVEHLQLLA